MKKKSGVPKVTQRGQHRTMCLGRLDPPQSNRRTKAGHGASPAWKQNRVRWSKGPGRCTARDLAGGRQREDHWRRFPGPAGSAGKGLGTPGSPRTSSGSAWRRAPGAESRCRRCRPLAGLPETPSCRTKAPKVYPLAHPPSQAPSEPLSCCLGPASTTRRVAPGELPASLSQED